MRIAFCSNARMVPEFVIMDAIWVVLDPGAAHTSRTRDPHFGASANTGSILERDCRYIFPSRNSEEPLRAYSKDFGSSYAQGISRTGTIGKTSLQAASISSFEDLREFTRNVVPFSEENAACTESKSFPRIFLSRETRSGGRVFK